MNLKILKRGHDTKGYMISDDDTLEILSFHKTEQTAKKRLKELMR